MKFFHINSENWFAFAMTALQDLSDSSRKDQYFTRKEDTPLGLHIHGHFTCVKDKRQISYITILIITISVWKKVPARFSLEYGHRTKLNKGE